ncbi:MAG: hypothetical protein ACYC63_07530 [Armatimonadota bacterium]
MRIPSSSLTVYGVLLVTCLSCAQALAEQRNEVSYLRGSYNTAFFERHNDAFSVSAAIHVAHGFQHDGLLLSPIAKSEAADAKWDAFYLRHLQDPPRTEPKQEGYAPFTSRHHWLVLRAIDWTHMHHEQTYDIMSERGIGWDCKKAALDRSVRYYLTRNDIPRSPAPLDITMRRAGVMMKPYFTLFRNYYPKSSTYFFFAHWWHPAIYEAQMIGGNDAEQGQAVRQINALIPLVTAQRPQRMLLSREIMPRWSRLTPESANIFDNLHMLHGIVYDIMAYEGWSLEQKRAELYRVVHAMSYQPGDEKLARKFAPPHPDMDPRVYEPWMRSSEGEMSRMMMEMMEEMMPMMMPQGMSPQQHEQMMAQVKMKLAPGCEPGEHPGSLHDAMMKMMPDMKMMPEATEPGKTPKMMIDAMLRGWQEKYGNMPDIEPMPMATEPKLPPLAACP